MREFGKFYILGRRQVFGDDRFFQAGQTKDALSESFGRYFKKYSFGRGGSYGGNASIARKAKAPEFILFGGFRAFHT